MTDADFLAALERCTLPESEFTHAAHVRAAYLISATFILPADDRMAATIRRYAPPSQAAAPTTRSPSVPGAHPRTVYEEATASVTVCAPPALVRAVAASYHWTLQCACAAGSYAAGGCDSDRPRRPRCGRSRDCVSSADSGEAAGPSRRSHSSGTDRALAFRFGPAPRRHLVSRVIALSRWLGRWSTGLWRCVELDRRYGCWCRVSRARCSRFVSWRCEPGLELLPPSRVRRGGCWYSSRPGCPRDLVAGLSIIFTNRPDRDYISLRMRRAGRAIICSHRARPPVSFAMCPQSQDLGRSPQLRQSQLESCRAPTTPISTLRCGAAGVA